MRKKVFIVELQLGYPSSLDKLPCPVLDRPAGALHAGGQRRSGDIGGIGASDAVGPSLKELIRTTSFKKRLVFVLALATSDIKIHAGR